jgi:thiamine-monophosphate kinase
VGWIEGAPVVTRLGAKPGDRLYATRAIGLGNAYATAFLMGHTNVAHRLEALYRPVARLAQGQQLRPWVSAMMDGSDGLVSSLDQLARLNGVGWEVDFVGSALDPVARQFMREMALPDWALLCGEHGDYELFFTVSGCKQAAFEAACEAWNWKPVPLGVAAAAPGIRLHADGCKPIQFEGSFVRNLLSECGGNWRAFVPAFWQYGHRLGLADIQLG